MAHIIRLIHIYIYIYQSCLFGVWSGQISAANFHPLASSSCHRYLSLQQNPAANRGSALRLGWGLYVSQGPGFGGKLYYGGLQELTRLQAPVSNQNCEIIHPISPKTKRSLSGNPKARTLDP